MPFLVSAEYYGRMPNSYWNNFKRKRKRSASQKIPGRVSQPCTTLPHLATYSFSTRYLILARTTPRSPLGKRNIRVENSPEISIWSQHSAKGKNGSREVGDEPSQGRPPLLPAKTPRSNEDAQDLSISLASNHPTWLWTQILSCTCRGLWLRQSTCRAALPRSPSTSSPRYVEVMSLLLSSWEYTHLPVRPHLSSVVQEHSSRHYITAPSALLPAVLILC